MAPIRREAGPKCTEDELEKGKGLKARRRGSARIGARPRHVGGNQRGRGRAGGWDRSANLLRNASERSGGARK